MALHPFRPVKRLRGGSSEARRRLAAFLRHVGLERPRDFLLAAALLWSTGTLVSLQRALTDFPAAALGVVAQTLASVWTGYPKHLRPRTEPMAAEVKLDGTMRGQFWSRDSYHAWWTARPVAEDEKVLPDAWRLVGLTNAEGRFDFTFPDLEGAPVSLADERFRDKVVLVNIFGSWCPNCNAVNWRATPGPTRSSEKSLVAGLANRGSASMLSAP